ncbi:NADP-dependent oxidoreductase domain [Trinorchestia longiramus]|nr:NADP-dependent oxidoreductase domain [Trinorchestia longiramus]
MLATPPGRKKRQQWREGHLSPRDRQEGFARVWPVEAGCFHQEEALTLNTIVEGLQRTQMQASVLLHISLREEASAVGTATGVTATHQNGHQSSISDTQHGGIHADTRTGDVGWINNQGAVLPSEREAIVDAIKHAVDVGYRHFDCAMLYGNEAEIGKGLRSKIEEGVVKREELFIVSKLWNCFHRKDLVVPTLKKSLADFGFSYLDLYLIHWPMSYKEGDGYFPKDATGMIIPGTEDYVDTWRAMEECVQLDLTKAIGVSNFNKRQLERIMAASTTVPAVNQIESHPYLSQTKQIDYCKSKGIAVTAYSPLGSPAGGWKEVTPYPLLKHPKILAIAQKYNKDISQVLIRYHIQRGVICIPKSSNKNRMKSNFEVFDFEMSPEDIEEMTKLNCNGRYVVLEA